MFSTPRRKRVCYTLDIHFGVEEEKEAFVRRLKVVRALISGEQGVLAVDNLGLMSAMFDVVEAAMPQASSAGNKQESVQSFMRNNGKF